MIGMGLGINSACPQGFDPRAFFASGEQGVFYAPWDLSTLFQDGAGTTPVTAAGQPVGLMKDKSGRGNHLTLSNATLDITGGLYSIACNGSTTSGVTAAIDFTGTGKLTAHAAIRKLSDAAFGVVYELSSAPTNNGIFGLYAPGGTGSATFNARSRGTADSQATTPTNYASPLTAVITQSAVIATDTNELRVNGALAVHPSSDQGTGAYGSYPLYIGRRGGTTAPLNGFIYGLIVRGAQSTAGQVASAERYLAARAGVTLP